jgi:hypothetical protein
MPVRGRRPSTPFGSSNRRCGISSSGYSLDGQAKDKWKGVQVFHPEALNIAELSKKIREVLDSRSGTLLYPPYSAIMLPRIVPHYFTLNIRS